MMGWWFQVIVAGCGERSELDGPCKTDAGCVSGLVCVKGSTSESAVDTCQIPCDANGMCDPGGCDECVDEPFADPPYCEFVGCS